MAETTTEKVHAALVKLDGEDWWFASLDGEEWLPCSRQPAADDTEAVRRMFEARRGFVPMRYARRFLTWQGATFLD